MRIFDYCGETIRETNEVSPRMSETELRWKFGYLFCVQKEKPALTKILIFFTKRFGKQLTNIGNYDKISFIYNVAGT